MNYCPALVLCCLVKLGEEGSLHSLDVNLCTMIHL